jgi:hypothetical protein
VFYFKYSPPPVFQSSKKTKALTWRYFSERAVGDSLNVAGEPYAEFVQVILSSVFFCQL